MFKNFVLGLYSYYFAISRAPLLSSYTLQWIFVIGSSEVKPLCLNSLRGLIIGMDSLSAYERPVYSLYVLDKAISVCICDLWSMGNPSYIITYPCLDLAVSVSSLSDLLQLPAKSTSTHTSNTLSLSGWSVVPSLTLSIRYFPSHLIAYPCSLLGYIDNLAHWWMMYAMSGLKLLSR